MRKLFLVLLTMPFAAQADFIGDRATFEATLDTIIIDDYENPGYSANQFDAAMSAVLGETQYVSTRATNSQNHKVFTNDGSNHKYCNGCNGSVLLDFTSTSVGNASGVFGVGFEYFNAGGIYGPAYVAFITYGDGSTENIALSLSQNGIGPLRLFFSVTSDSLISSIHLGLENGVGTPNGLFGLDNLTIGNSRTPVPEPSTLALLGIGLLGMGLARRRKQLA